jgi:hypothetical protein
MLKRHVYTCPDVIHMRKVNRNLNRTIIGIEAGLLVAVFAVGSYVDWKGKKTKKPDLEIVPDPEN